jgi:hypothetical protein
MIEWLATSRGIGCLACCCRGTSSCSPWCWRGGGAAKTLPVAAAQLIGQREIQWNELCAVSTAALLPLLVFFAFVNKYLVRGMIAGAVKS